MLSCFPASAPQITFSVSFPGPPSSPPNWWCCHALGLGPFVFSIQAHPLGDLIQSHGFKYLSATNGHIYISSPVQFSSIVQSCPTLCDPHGLQHTQSPCQIPDNFCNPTSYPTSSPEHQIDASDITHVPLIS